MRNLGAVRSTYTEIYAHVVLADRAAAIRIALPNFTDTPTQTNAGYATRAYYESIA